MVLAGSLIERVFEVTNIGLLGTGEEDRLCAEKEE